MAPCEKRGKGKAGKRTAADGRKRDGESKARYQKILKTKKELATVQNQLRIDTERRISLEGEVHMLKAKVKQAKGLRLSEAEKLLLGY